MKGRLFFYGIVLSLLGAGIRIGNAQTIAYSVPMNDNIRSTSFDIIGKCDGRLLIFKRSFNDHVIALYDRDMKVLDIVPLTFLPKDVKATHFVNFGDRVMMIYEYTRKRNTYCEALLLNGEAKPVTKPLYIDNTASNQKIVGDKAYSVLYSDDKRKIMIIQAQRDADSMRFRLRSFLLDPALQSLRKDSLAIPYARDSDRLEKFTLSNTGDLYFILGSAAYSSDTYFDKLFLYCRTAEGRLYADSIPLQGRKPERSVLLTLDDARHKVWITSLNYEDKGRDIDYLFVGKFSGRDIRPLSLNMILLDDTLKNKLRGKGENTRRAMDNYVLTKQIVDQEEHALVVGEKQYRDVNGVDHYDDLMLLSLDASGGVMQARKIRKTQSADLTDAFSSYLMINTGGALHFLMNKPHKIFRFINNYVYLLADYRYDARHELKEMPVLRGQDNKKRWAPRYGAQVSRNEVVIPCRLGNGLIFGKITY